MTSLFINDVELFIVTNTYRDKPRYQCFKYMIKDQYGFIHAFCNDPDGNDMVHIDALRLDHNELMKKNILESWFSSTMKKHYRRRRLGEWYH